MATKLDQMSSNSENKYDEETKCILELCEKHKSGITNAVITNSLPLITPQQMKEVLNSLLMQKKILLFRKGDTNMFKLNDPVLQYKMKGLSKEEQAVYMIIERCGSSGIWVKKIRNESNLHLKVIDKILKRLETQKKIKSINSVQAPKKKFYLVCGVEPDRSLTGGAFFTDNQFDTTFVDILLTTCYKFLENKRKEAEKRQDTESPLSLSTACKVTAKEVLQYIEKIKICKTKLSTTDVEKLLDTLVLDGNVSCDSTSGGGVKLWRAIPNWSPNPGMTLTPCGMCPMINQCADIGLITPDLCPYLDEWCEDIVLPVSA